MTLQVGCYYANNLVKHQKLTQRSALTVTSHSDTKKRAGADRKGRTESPDMPTAAARPRLAVAN